MAYICTRSQAFHNLKKSLKGKKEYILGEIVDLGESGMIYREWFFIKSLS